MRYSKPQAGCGRPEGGATCPLIVWPGLASCVSRWGDRRSKIFALTVMAGRVPAICASTAGVDGRDTSGHDGEGVRSPHLNLPAVCYRVHRHLTFGPYLSMQPPRRVSLQ